MTDEEIYSRKLLMAKLNEAGFYPKPASLAEIHAAVPLLKAMQARLRRSYDYLDEPSETFLAEDGYNE